MLKIIKGRSGSGKSSLIREELGKKIRSGSFDKRLILLVPEQFTLQAERDLISDQNLLGLLNVEVLSFKRLAYKVFNEVGGKTHTLINDLARIMLIRDLFSRYNDKLKIYKNMLNKNAFYKNINYFITELKKNEIKPADLEKYLKKNDEMDLASEKLEDIVFIYKKYQEYMSKRYYDPEDEFAFFIKKISSSNMLDEAEIWIDGFTGFTGQEDSIIRNLLKKSKNISISLTMDEKNSGIFKPSEDTYNKLKNIAVKDNIEIEEIFLNNQNKCNEEIRHLESHLYRYPLKGYKDKTDNIELFIARNRYSEVEKTALKIISLVRDRNYRWRDIAIVIGDINLYKLYIKKVFSEYNIPFFLDEKRSIMKNPIVKYIDSALKIVQNNFSYEDIFRYLKTGFSNLSRNEFELLENYVLEFGIDGNDWYKEFKLGNEDYNLEDLNILRKKLIEPIISLKKALNESSTFEDYIKTLFSTFKELSLKEKIEDWLDILKSRKQFEDINENTQIWNVIIDIFKQLLDILGDKDVKLKEFIEILEMAFSEYEIGIIPTTLDQVLVGNLDRSRSHDIKALFVLGVNDGILPSKNNKDYILRDEEKVHLQKYGIDINSDSINEFMKNRFNIYATFSKPREFFRASYAAADMEGQVLRPSLLYRQLEKLFPEVKVSSDFEDLDDMDLISNPRATIKYLVLKLRNFIDNGYMEKEWWLVYNWYYQNKKWKASIDKILKALFYSNLLQNIDKKRIAKLYELPLRSSVSRIEKYFECPFAHYIDYGLRPRPRKELEVDYRDIGSFMHIFIEIFFRKLLVSNFKWMNISQDEINLIVEKVMEEINHKKISKVFENNSRDNYLINKLKRTGRRTIEVLLKHLEFDNYTPSFFELDFSKKGEFPALELSLNDEEKMYIEGRIDRVDLADNGLVKIIDYKSGNKDFDLSRLYHGLQLQLIVYMSAILHTNKNYRPAAVFYFKIDDPLLDGKKININNIEKERLKKFKLNGLVLDDMEIFKSLDNELEQGGNSLIIPVRLKKDGKPYKYSSVIDEENLKKLINYVHKKISEAGREIIKGKINIEPVKYSSRTACEYCDYKSICKFDRKISSNQYKVLNKKDKDEIFTLLSEEVEGVDEL